MSKVGHLFAVASRFENKYAVPLRYFSGSEKKTIEELLFDVANQALRASNMLEQSGEDSKSIKEFHHMHGFLIPTAAENANKALQKYISLLKKHSLTLLG